MIILCVNWNRKKKQVTTANSNRRQLVIYDVKEMLTPNEWIQNSLHRRRQMRSRTQFHLQIWYKYVRNFTTFFYSHDYYTTTPFNSRHRHLHSSVHSFTASCLLAMATSIRKTLQRLSDKCSGGGIIWPQAVFSSPVLLCYISLLLDELLCSVYTCTAFNTTLSKRSDSVPFSNSVISILVRYVLRPHIKHNDTE